MIMTSDVVMILASSFFSKVINSLFSQDGANIAVTDANKDEYLSLRLRHRMLDSIKPQLQHLLIGKHLRHRPGAK